MSKIPVKNVTPEEKSLYVPREKIQVREIHGFFQKIRSYSLWGLMALFFATSWLSWSDRQAVLFDLPARQFHIFGITFWPQPTSRAESGAVIPALNLLGPLYLCGSKKKRKALVTNE